MTSSMSESKDRGQGQFQSSANAGSVTLRKRGPDSAGGHSSERRLGVTSPRQRTEDRGRSTATTSTRSKSGPAAVSPQSRSRNRRPSGPASATTGASTEASTTSTFLVECLDRGLRRQRTLRTPLDPVADLLHRRRRCDLCELCGEELLKRLAGLLRSADQHLMDLVRNISYLTSRCITCEIAR